MQTSDLDRSIRPGKWQKRGVQPEVQPTRKSLLASLHELAVAIREEPDPRKKTDLQRQYKAETKALDALTSDPTSAKLKEALVEIVDVFSPIIDPPADIADEIEMPESMTRGQWKNVHGRILQCNRFASKWLNKSRKFASERWGDEFVSKSEHQMELSLGIESKQSEGKKQSYEREVAVAVSLAKGFTRLLKITESINDWPLEKSELILSALNSIDEMSAALKQKLANPSVQANG